MQTGRVQSIAGVRPSFRIDPSLCLHPEAKPLQYGHEEKAPARRVRRLRQRRPEDGGHADRRAGKISRAWPASTCEPVAIFTGRHGAPGRPERHRPGRGAASSSGKTAHFPAAPMTVLQALETLDYDVLVELSTLDIEQKGRAGHLPCARRPGAGQACGHGQQGAGGLRLPANSTRWPGRSGVRFLFESAVMDGAPVFSLRRALARLPGHRHLRHSQHHHQFRHLPPGSRAKAWTAP